MKGIFLHEAAHALAKERAGDLSDSEVISVEVEGNGNVWGFVGPRNTAAIVRSDPAIREDEVLTDDAIVASGIDADAHVETHALIYLVGVAAQFPRSSGWSANHEAASARDRALLQSVAHRWRVTPRLSTWWTQALEFVDRNWGAIEAAADALESQGTLTANEFREIVAHAPNTKNLSRAPRESNLAYWKRALVDGAVEIREAIEIVFDAPTERRADFMGRDLAEYIRGLEPTREVNERIASSYEGLSPFARASYVPRIQDFEALVRADAEHRRAHGRPRSREDLEATLRDLRHSTASE